MPQIEIRGLRKVISVLEMWTIITFLQSTITDWLMRLLFQAEVGRQDQKQPWDLCHRLCSAELDTRAHTLLQMKTPSALCFSSLLSLSPPLQWDFNRLATPWAHQTEAISLALSAIRTRSNPSFSCCSHLNITCDYRYETSLMDYYLTKPTIKKT